MEKALQKSKLPLKSISLNRIVLTTQTVFRECFRISGRGWLRMGGWIGMKGEDAFMVWLRPQGHYEQPFAVADAGFMHCSHLLS